MGTFFVYFYYMLVDDEIRYLENLDFAVGLQMDNKKV